MKGEKGAHHLASELVAPSPTFLLIPWHWLALCSVLHCAFLYHSYQHLHPHSLHLDPYQFTCRIIYGYTNGADSKDHMFTRMEGMVDTGTNGDNNGSIKDLVAGDEEGENSVASVEDQLRKGMTVYDMFCKADPPYDKTLLQLQSFLSGLFCNEKLLRTKKWNALHEKKKPNPPSRRSLLWLGIDDKPTPSRVFCACAGGYVV
ncbi:hypothetical protein EV2_011745 [Malus domestica]